MAASPVPTAAHTVTWCQEQAVVAGEPEVQQFFRGPSETFRKTGFAGLPQVKYPLC